jgi:ribosomal protein L22
MPRLPRRTICYTRTLRAEEDGSKTSPGANKTTIEASKSSLERSKTTPEDSKPDIDPGSSSSVFSAMKNVFFNNGKPAKKPKRPLKQAEFQRQGSLTSDSIFSDAVSPLGGNSSGPLPEDTEETGTLPLEQREKHTMSMTLDPHPRSRKKWERKMIIREVRKRGRVTKKEAIMATERDALVKSHWFKTSVKKLVPLARQIQGKSIDDAILQMRFSKKKAAKDVKEHLEHAKNIAIVRYGMGLEKPDDKESKIQPVTITLKSGDPKTITNPSAIYIADSWVNRGPFHREYDHRARGRINIMRPPHTGISVVLKEERTQIREWKVREARALRQRKSMLWVQLPNRPVSSQNQYYSW